MTVFYDFLKAQSEKASGFDVFSYQTKSIDSTSLTQAQFAAFESANGMQISQQIVLEQDGLPRNAAISITIPITITWDAPV
ncbi:MAG: hypothetical protein KA508_07310 [Gammaproteobacteria bacterium]|jgi:hypothetical protein|nr:hypothetical protein [Gammaproteobacteria bacterium]